MAIMKERFVEKKRIEHGIRHTTVFFFTASMNLWNFL